ncbi:MAG: hypothetical protein QXO86_00665 [Nitrososphaerota archaeon]
MLGRDTLGSDRLRSPGTILPSDIEPLIREVLMLKEEIRKIKKALEEHGIKVE